MEKQKRSELYKSKNGGIDPKALRAHRRSIEWKSFRNTEVNKRRNLSEDLSPVKEGGKKLTKAEIKRQQASDKRAQLEKWKKEKELKRKLEAQRKMPVFKVKHCNSKEYERLEAEKRAKQRSAMAAQRKAATRPAPPKAPPPKPVSTRGPPTQPPASKRQARAPPAPVSAPRSTRTTRATTTKGTTQRKQDLEVKKPASSSTTGRVTRSRATVTTTKTNKKPDAKPKTTRSTRTKPESPSTPTNVNVSRGGLVFGYAENTEFTFNAPFEFKPLTPRSTRKMLGGEDLSPIPWANKRRASPPAGPWCSTPRDATTDVASPPVSAIPQEAPKKEQPAKSNAKPLPEPIMKLTDALTASPALTKRRRSSRRPPTSSGSEEEVNKKEETTSDTMPQKPSSPTETTSNKSASRQRSTRRSVAEPVPDDAVKADDAPQTEQVTTVTKAPPRRSTRRSLSSGSSSEEETKKSGKIPRNSPLSSTCDSVELLEKNVFSSTGLSVASTEVLEAIQEETEPPPEKAANHSAPADLEKCDSSSSFFRTPRSVTKKAHRRTLSDIISLNASAKKTPKALRTSFILRHLSPEEGVEVLKMSPMIEMNRRTSKPTSPLANLSPMPTFEDIDDYVPPPPAPGQDSDTKGEGAVEAKDEEASGGEGESVAEGPAVETGAASSVPQLEAPVASEAGAAPGPVVHDVPYFRQLLVTETERLDEKCSKWEQIMRENDLSEEVEGEVRTTIGKAQLLIAQRFKQFRGLVDNCEFNKGEKETTCQDLDGFWDMVYFQVEDVEAMFANLAKLQANNWVKEKPKVAKKKLVKKNPSNGSKKPAGGPRSKMAEFIAAKRRAQEEKERAAAQAETTESAPEVVISAPAAPVAGAVGSEKKEVTKLSGGSFVVSSPGKSPRSFTKSETPRKSLSRKSKVLTPGGCTPLMRCVLVNNARKSMGANSIPKQASRRSSVDGGQPAVEGGRRRSNSEQFPRRSQGSRSSQGPVENSPSVDSTEGKKEEEAAGTLSPIISSIAQSHSIFTPENDTPRRSLRRSVVPMDVDPVVPEANVVTDDIFSQYLMPSSEENTQQSPAPIEEDNDVEDVDMAAKSKRDLVTEFNKHSKSAKKRRNSCVPLPQRDVSEVLTSQQPSSLRRSRRSVHFSSLMAPEGDKVGEKVPATPANINSLVPALLRGAERGGEEQKENRKEEEESFVSPVTPTAKLARLRVETPGVSTRQSTSLLFTPPQDVEPPEPEDGTVNLMSFSPSVMAQLQEAAEGYRGSPGHRRPRRQSRLSLL